MSPASAIKISEAQLKLVKLSLDLFQPHIVERGAALMRSRAVRAMEQAKPGGDIFAKVQGGNLYTVHLEFSPQNDVLFCDCTCPYGEDCKHAAAALLELRKHATLLGGALAQAPETVKKAPAAKAAPEVDPKSLAGLVQTKLGRVLPKSAVKFLNEVEPWWRNKTNAIEKSQLYRVLGIHSHWGYGYEQIYPEPLPPQDEWEFLAYVEIAVQNKHGHLPEALAGMVDKQVKQRVLLRWARHMEVSNWKATLRQWQVLESTKPAPRLRLRLLPAGAQVELSWPGRDEYVKATQTMLRELAYGRDMGMARVPLEVGSELVLAAVSGGTGAIHGSVAKPMTDELRASLESLASVPSLFDKHVVGPAGQPLRQEPAPLRWELLPPETGEEDYQLRLLDAEGRLPEPPLAVLQGPVTRYVTPEVVYSVPCWPLAEPPPAWPLRIPAPALESVEGLGALVQLKLPPPPRMQGKVKVLKAEIAVRCRYQASPYQGAGDSLHVKAEASFHQIEPSAYWNGTSWLVAAVHKTQREERQSAEEWVHVDHSPLGPVTDWLQALPGFQPTMDKNLPAVVCRAGRDFPDQFIRWMAHRPDDLQVELDPELASLVKGQVAGKLRLDIEESKTGMDWFDLSVAVDVTDTTLTQEEIAILLKARGKWVRLPNKGWRKLDFQLSDEHVAELAEMGLSIHDLQGGRQRLHALQLSGAEGKAGGLLPADRAAQIRRRTEEIHTRVSPEVPPAIVAELRPYQIEGFHFLAYLSTNGFGGVLADDMGLGKTLQTLAWMAWLRHERGVKEPMLVVCPKSVQDNWRAEAARFFPALRLEVWNRQTAGTTKPGKTADLTVIHYGQLRQHEEALKEITWGAVVLDEAQAIKNPDSQSARSACALEARHRLALTGTPVENRLLDLWAILAFAMPGVLGTRAAFTRNFDAPDDPLSRRRLAARTRPFLLRRTKKEVARDLPERVEEDLVVEMDGAQASLYKAELKRARAQLLKAELGGGLDKMRFNILTSLLRLRQICCHPRLVGMEDGAPVAKRGRKTAETQEGENAPPPSAKTAALLELLEPLMQEGQKVLVFSQFVEMLEIIEAGVAAQGWTHFKLTGSTEDRGDLVSRFQQHEGAAIFLISLKAGGSGLNLTAASYVVLFDPWWNPAVEAQAIDRTHRIGQRQTVFAYRLLVKESIEEKIRLLQKQKGALAQDILGEESFARALTLSDFQFLLGDG